jgi:hypothetical protein
MRLAEDHIVAAEEALQHVRKDRDTKQVQHQLCLEARNRQVQNAV